MGSQEMNQASSLSGECAYNVTDASDSRIPIKQSKALLKKGGYNVSSSSNLIREPRMKGSYDCGRLIGAQEHSQKRTRCVNLPVELAESDYDSSSVMSSRASTNYHSNRSHILY